MVPIESIETINRRLTDHYGQTNDMPNYRIVWSEDQFEFRKTNFTDEGLELIYPETRRLPKYRQWINEKFVLERLSEVPAINQEELELVLSYEPLWVFEDKEGFSLKPAWIVCKFVVDQVHKNIEEAGLYTKYPDPYSGLTNSQLLEKKDAELKELEAELFGDENDITDALAYGDGVGFTTSKIKES